MCALLLKEHFNQDFNVSMILYSDPSVDAEPSIEYHYAGK